MTAYRCVECGYQFRSAMIPNFKTYKRCPKCKSTEIVKVSAFILSKYVRGNLASQQEFRGMI